VALKENRNLQAALVLIPLGIVFVVLETAKSRLSPEILDTVNIIAVFESLAAGLAIILLVGKRLTPSKWYISIGAAVLILAIVGFAGATGADDGRYIAATKITWNTFRLQAAIWLLAIISTALLCRKKYSRVRFNCLALLSFFIFHMLGMYIITLAMATNAPWAGLAGNMVLISIGALVLGIIHYLITLPYLILAYRSADYDKRLLDWLGQS